MAKKIQVFFIIVAIGSIVLVATITYLSQKHKNEINRRNTIVTGLTPGQGQYFQKELASAFQVSSYVQKGKSLLNQGKYDEAIEVFKHAMSVAKMQGEKSMARLYVVDAYEKKRDYKNALDWMIIARDKCYNEWAKGPHIERVKYLEYALQGEYDLAIEHAKKALEEDKAIGAGQLAGYQQRLIDLIAAKDYILSLKKK